MPDLIWAERLLEHSGALCIREVLVLMLMIVADSVSRSQHLCVLCNVLETDVKLRSTAQGKTSSDPHPGDNLSP